MKTSTTTTYIEPTEANVKTAIENIKLFAEKNGYQIKGNFTVSQNLIQSIFGKGLTLRFESKSLQKVCRDYLTRMDRKLGMCVINTFLHFLYKRIYKLDNAPQIEYSEKELKIKAAQKAWKKSMHETESRRLAYKIEKADFYKKTTA